MPELDFLVPDSVDEALVLLAKHPYGKVIAGGTAVVLMLQQGLIFPQELISLAHLEELRGISVDDDELQIGALTTLTEVAASPLVRRHFPSLAYSCQRVGNVRIRNVATLGGNMAEADYASDPPAVLASLGARCVILSTEGSRTVATADFISGFYTTVLTEGELLTAIRIPLPDAEQRTTYLKYISRSSEDRPCVGVAARGVFDGAVVTDLDVVVGAVAPSPQRFPEVLQAARGQTLNQQLTERIAADYVDRIDPIDDMRGSAWYRRQMVRVFVRRALEDIAPSSLQEAPANA